MDATVTVTDVEDVGPDTYAIRFGTPDGFAAEPGQFVKLGTEIDGESVARFYTLSSPTVDETFEVTVGIDPDDGGAFSAFLTSIEPGVELSLSGPFGDQHYDGERRVVILAGGPGVGPAVAIAERAVTEGGEAAIVYRDDEPAHGGRLKRLRDAGASIYLLDGDVELDAATADVVTGAGDEGLFVYGFADFVADAEAAIEATIGDADDAKVENFG
ncbi:FAD-dependent oxidoreductase [Halorubrum vacuolatum]|uniref:Ferredoxin-NADP reductase n=1 Tax=Halorubrum vacuolatum TaxID=63740 RepID=A0A238UNN4_HALVU|nr:FAD-dependent oxidoreductase [Halorubrum vacuolatum]SNR23716.1 Ferredoxin-NADP reductase [Halorubrum vacuolatum]